VVARDQLALVTDAERLKGQLRGVSRVMSRLPFPASLRSPAIDVKKA